MATEFVHFGNDGVDYLKIYIQCPVCIEHDWPTTKSFWYHHRKPNGDECGGEMYLGDNGYYKCGECGYTSPALLWKYCCPNHEAHGNQKFLGISDGKFIANALSVSGQLLDKVGLIWMNKITAAFIKFDQENPGWNQH